MVAWNRAGSAVDGGAGLGCLVEAGAAAAGLARAACPLAPDRVQAGSKASRATVAMAPSRCRGGDTLWLLLWSTMAWVVAAGLAFRV